MTTLSKSLWLWALAASALAMIVGFGLFDQWQVLGIAIGCATGLTLVFMLQRMGDRALSQGGTGKALIFGIFLKSFIRFLLTGVVLAILFYLDWLKPLGFMIGFTAVIVSIFVWGCSRLFMAK